MRHPPQGREFRDHTMSLEADRSPRTAGLVRAALQADIPPREPRPREPPPREPPPREPPPREPPPREPPVARADSGGVSWCGRQ
jgi:hypothetical protein